MQKMTAQEIYFADAKNRFGKLNLDQCSFEYFSKIPPNLFAFNPDGKLYSNPTTTSVIATYDLNTGIQTVIKTLKGGFIFGSMTSDSSGLIYISSAINSVNDAIYTFDPKTSEEKFLGPIFIAGTTNQSAGGFSFHNGGVYFTNGNSIVEMTGKNPSTSTVFASLNTSDVFTGIFDYYVCNQKKTYVVATSPTDTFTISNIYEFNWATKSFTKVCSPAVKIAHLTGRFGFVPPPKVDTVYTTARTCDVTKTIKPETVKTTSLLGCDSYITTTYFLQNDTMRHDSIDCKRKIAAYSDTLRIPVGTNCSRIQINTYRPAPRRNDSVYSVVRFCEGDSTFVSNNWVKETTLYNNLFKNIYGCDSTSFLKITAAPPHDTIFKSRNICRGDTIKVGRFLVTESGDYISPIPNNLTCDTAILLHVTVISPDTAIINRVSCNPLNVGSKLEKKINPLGCFNFTRTNTTLAQNPTLTLHIADLIHTRIGDSLILSPVLNFIPKKVKWKAQDSLSFSCDSCLTTVIKPQMSALIHFYAANDDDCAVETDIKIFVDPLRHIYIPDAFSPNEDKVNDIFTIYGDNQLETIKTLKIFDRWGSLVFEQDNLPIGNGWDGKFKGAYLSPDIFTYFAIVKFTDGYETIYKGDVRILK